MTNNLFKYMDFVQKELEDVQKIFFEQWNDTLKAHLNTIDDLQIQEYIDIFGGYWIGIEEYENMNYNLRKFYDTRKIKRRKIFLRGYDYYQVDPLLNRKIENGNVKELWKNFQYKWNSYTHFDSFDFLINPCLTLEDWIGMLGVLEYLFSDITTLHWFAFKNPLIEGRDYIIQEIETKLEIVGESISCMLRFDFEKLYGILSCEYNKIFTSQYLRNLIFAEHENITRSSVRSVREGDSMVLIYAAYAMKLKPFCRKNNFKQIHLVSNAFGAMNIGIILKHLLGSECIVTHTNVYYAQHRVSEDLLYQETELNRFCYICEKKDVISKETEAVFVVDDSIFSGKSYSEIKKKIPSGFNVYSLPLTLNCNCLKYCRLGISDRGDIDIIAREVVKWSKEVNGTLPPFTSFWDFEYVVPENKFLVEHKELHDILSGNDLLAKHLWNVYYDEIVKSNFNS